MKQALVGATMIARDATVTMTARDATVARVPGYKWLLGSPEYHCPVAESNISSFSSS